MRYKTTIRPPGIDCTPQGTVILSFEPQDEYSLYGYFTTQEPISAADMWYFDIVECPTGEDAPRVGQIRIDRCAIGSLALGGI